MICVVVLLIFINLASKRVEILRLKGHVKKIQCTDALCSAWLRLRKDPDYKSRFTKQAERLAVSFVI